MKANPRRLRGPGPAQRKARTARIMPNDHGPRAAVERLDLPAPTPGRDYFADVAGRLDIALGVAESAPS